MQLATGAYGERASEAAARKLGPGGFYTEPARQPRFAFTNDLDAVVYITGDGPNRRRSDGYDLRRRDRLAGPHAPIICDGSSKSLAPTSRADNRLFALSKVHRGTRRRLRNNIDNGAEGCGSVRERYLGARDFGCWYSRWIHCVC